MHIRYAFGLLSCSIGWSVAAQVTFNVVHNYTVAQGWPDAGGASGTSVTYSDSSFIVFGHQVSTDGFTKPFCFLFDPNGASQWDVEHMGTISMHYNFGYADPVEKEDGSLTSALSEFDNVGDSLNRLLLARFAANGDTLWTKVVWDSCFCGVMQTRSSANGHYALVGFNAFQANLTVVDTAGAVLWERIYPNTTLGLTVQPIDPVGYVISGQQLGGVDNGSWVMRLDSVGDVVWRRDFGGSKHATGNVCAMQTQDGGIVATCRYMPIGANWSDPGWNYFRKWNINGDLIWTRLYNQQFQTTSFDLEELPNGDIVATGSELSVQHGSNGLLFRLDNDGDLIWLRRYKYYGQSTHIPYDVEQTPDGGFVLAGRASQGGTDSLPGLQMVWLLKTDSFGCVVPGCQLVGVEEYELGLNEQLRIWPNPVAPDGQVQVLLELPEGYPVTGQARLVVMDAMGRTVKEEKMNRAGNLLSHALTLAPCSPGIYYLHLADDHRWLAGTKLVVE